MIHIIAIITAKPGNRETILEAFRANMPAVHAEAGCIEYGPAIDTEGAGRIQTPMGPDTFVVIEKWAQWVQVREKNSSTVVLAVGEPTERGPSVSGSVSARARDGMAANPAVDIPAASRKRREIISWSLKI